MKLLLIGAGSHAKVVLDVAHAAGFDEIAFLDDAAQSRARFHGFDLFGTTADLPHAATRGFTNFLVSIGDNRAREQRFRDALACGLTPATLIHPSAVVSPSAQIGAGSVIMPRAVINAEAMIGSNCIINTGAVVEHDCVIADHVHISPCAALGGGARVGKSAHVGIGAVLLPLVEIGAATTVGAGAVVICNVPERVTVVGVPARPLDRR